jgi:hypothetical protein
MKGENTQDRINLTGIPEWARLRAERTCKRRAQIHGNYTLSRLFIDFCATLAPEPEEGVSIPSPINEGVVPAPQPVSPPRKKPVKRATGPKRKPKLKGAAG